MDVPSGKSLVFGPLMMHPAQVVNKMFMMNRMTGTDTRIPRVPPLRTPRILTPLIAANEREICRNEEHKLRNGVPDGGHSNLRERVDEEQVLAGKERLNDDHHTDDNWTIEHDNGSHDAEEARLQGAW